jgi:hypothetical protein
MIITKLVYTLVPSLLLISLGLTQTVYGRSKVDDRGRMFHSSGSWDSALETFTIQAGQGVNIVIKNTNIIPLDICVTDITWTSGEQKCTVIPSYRTRSPL